MNILQLLLLLTGLTLALNILGFITQYAADCLRRRQRVAPAESSSEKPETTAGFWWRKAFSMYGIVGFVFCFPQAYILWVNSNLIAQNFETLLDRGGIPLMSIMVFGMAHEITDLYLYGALIATAQMVAASALYQQTRKQNEPSKLLSVLASTALLALIVFEVGSSVYRGLTVDGGMRNTVMSGVLALGLASLDALVGVYLIDWFLAPLLLAVAWTLAIPIHTLSRWAAKTDAAYLVLIALSAVDHAVMAPLRRVDRCVSGLLPDRTSTPDPNQEGNADAAEKTHELVGDRSRNGHEPGWMPGQSPAGPRFHTGHVRPSAWP